MMPNDDVREILMPLSDANDLDEVVHELSIEASDTTPAEAVRELKAEITRLRSELSALRGGGREPVAWRYELAHAKWEEGEYTDWRWRLSETEPHVPKGSIRNLTPLYAAPVPPAPDRLRKALEKFVEADPNDMAADGVTVFDVWQKEARAALAEGGETETTISSDELLRRTGHDRSKPFEVGPFPPEMRMPSTEANPYAPDIAAKLLKAVEPFAERATETLARGDATMVAHPLGDFRRAREARDAAIAAGVKVEGE